MHKISIITVTYNCVDILESTILSVLQQDYKNIEYIIVDGQSTDGTIDLVSTYETQITKFVSEKDSGIYDAMNKGLSLCTGDWVFFLNAGDVFYDSHVLSQTFATDKLCCDVCWGDYYARIMGKLVFKKCNLPFYQNTQHYHGMGFSHQSVFVRAEWAKRMKFDLSYRCCADYDMMMRLYKAGAKFHYLEQSIAIVVGGEGFSYSNSKVQMKDTGRILGIEHTMRFKIYYQYWNLKQFVKRLIGRK